MRKVREEVGGEKKEGKKVRNLQIEVEVEVKK